MSSGRGHFIISSLSLADKSEFWAQFKLWSVTISNHYCLSCFEPFLKGLMACRAFKATVWFGSASKTLSNVPLIRPRPGTQRRHVYVQGAE